MVRNVLLIALGSLVMLAALSSAYTVDEREQVLITQFGRPVASHPAPPAARDGGAELQSGCALLPFRSPIATAAFG